MVHGDIRLDNILVDKDGNPWFIDFETAFLADSIESIETREAMFKLDREDLSGCFQSVQLQED
jgi:RIO-like serine/threonine protein kinase